MPPGGSNIYLSLLHRTLLLLLPFDIVLWPYGCENHKNYFRLLIYSYAHDFYRCNDTIKIVWSNLEDNNPELPKSQGNFLC